MLLQGVEIRRFSITRLKQNDVAHLIRGFHELEKIRFSITRLKQNVSRYQRNAAVTWKDKILDYEIETDSFSWILRKG